MSKFNPYARKLDEIAQQAFKEYTEAAARLRTAENDRRAYPARGALSADHAARAARAEADFAEATAELDRVRRSMAEGEYRQKIKELRTALAAELTDAYSADPAQIDTKALELLKSGIMDATDYNKMLRTALAAENYTMARLVGKYADNAAAARESDVMHGNDRTAQELRAIAIESRKHTGSNYLEAFDFMADTFNRCTDNPPMIESWGELTAQTVERF